MDKFELAEEKGRNIFQRFLNSVGITNVEFSKEKYDVYDATFFDKDGKLWVTEIKNRDKKYAKYDDMLIEKKKVDNLNELIKPFKKELIGAMYVNVYEGTNDVKVANLNQNINFYSESHVATTSGNNNKVSKMVGYIKKFLRFKF